MEREIPPGYAPWGEQGIVLIDPTECPAGHPWADDGWQRSFSPCYGHGGHPSWRCHCGRMQYLRREDGAIVEQLDCVDPNFGQQRASR
jgi:hypothetical protein